MGSRVNGGRDRYSGKSFTSNTTGTYGQRSCRTDLLLLFAIGYSDSSMTVLIGGVLVNQCGVWER